MDFTVLPRGALRASWERTGPGSPRCSRSSPGRPCRPAAMPTCTAGCCRCSRSGRASTASSPVARTSRCSARPSGSRAPRSGIEWTRSPSSPSSSATWTLRSSAISSGMLSRLSFAIAMQFPADIYIFDEVLAVVDGEFQARCLDEIKGLHREGRTVIFVSHSLHQVADVCERVMWLDGGRLARRRADRRRARRLHGSALRPLAMARAPSPTVSVTIVLHNSERELRALPGAIRPEILSGFAELIAVDNASPDDSAGDGGARRCRPPGSSVRLENLGFAAGANLAWPHVARSLLAAPQPRRRARRGWDREARRVDGRPSATRRGQRRARGTDRRRAPSTGRALPSPWRPLLEASRLHLLLPRARSRPGSCEGRTGAEAISSMPGWVPATALMARREAIESAGLLDERFFLYGEDIEWCWRMRQSRMVHRRLQHGARLAPGRLPALLARLPRRLSGGAWSKARSRRCERSAATAMRACTPVRPPCARDRVASPRSVRGARRSARTSGARLASRRDGGGAASTALEASVVISTFNRADALAETLEPHSRSRISPNDSYEVIVVDDGSTDDTWARLGRGSTAVQPANAYGTSTTAAYRPAATRASALARGRTLIFVSDDVLVPPDFVRRHVEMLERMPGYWVVGAFRQRDSVTRHTLRALSGRARARVRASANVTRDRARGSGR